MCEDLEALFRLIKLVCKDITNKEPNRLFPSDVMV